MKKEEIQAKLKKWSEITNIEYNEILNMFSENFKALQEIYPNLDKDILIKKALLKTKTNIKTKLLGFSGLTEEYIFYCIGVSNIRDPLQPLRESVMEKFRQYLKEGLEDRAFREGIVKKVGENIIPLYPKTRRDGQPSKLAGEPIPQPPESLAQTVIGIGKSVNSNELNGMVLELRGQATSNQIQPYKSYKVSAVNFTKDSRILDIRTRQSKPVECEFDYDFNNGEDIRKYFGENIVQLNEIKNWVSNNQIPDKYARLTIVDNVICSFPSDLSVSARGNTIINFDSGDFDLDEKPFLLRGVLSEELIKYIDFPEMTEVMAIGQPWLVKSKDEEGNEITDCAFRLLNVIPIEKTKKIDKVGKI